MNRIAKSLCMIAVMALAFTACKKNDTDNQVLQFNGTTEQFMVVDDEIGEKVYLDGNGYFQFEENDTIMIFNIPDMVNGSGSGSQAARYIVQDNGTWSHDDGPIDGTTAGAYFAYYPGNRVNTSDFTNENRVKFTLQPTQNDRRDANNKVMIPKGCLYSAAKDEAHQTLTQTWFDFKNICGILSLRLYGASQKTVTKIQVTDNRYNVVGDVTLKIHEVNPTYMTQLFRDYDENNSGYMHTLKLYLEQVGYAISGDVRKTVELNCGTGVQLGATKATATEFYIVMRPLALLKGCTVKVFFSDDTYKEIKSTKNNCIGPNVIKRMNPVNVG